MITITNRLETFEKLKEKGYELMTDEPLSQEDAKEFAEHYFPGKEVLLNLLPIGYDVYIKTGEQK